MTQLRKLMLEELQRRNYSDSTARGYLRAVAAFAKHFGRPPDQLGPDDLRRYQAYLLKKRKLTVGTVIDDASGMYLAGQVTSPIGALNHTIWARIWLSNTKSSEFLSTGSCSSN